MDRTKEEKYDNPSRADSAKPASRRSFKVCQPSLPSGNQQLTQLATSKKAFQAHAYMAMFIQKMALRLWTITNQLDAIILRSQNHLSDEGFVVF